MRSSPRVVDVSCIDSRQLRIVFTDGLVREIDFAGALQGILTTIDDDEVFSSVQVDRVAGTISWPGDIDLDPDVLHGDFTPASGSNMTVLAEYELQES